MAPIRCSPRDRYAAVGTVLDVSCFYADLFSCSFLAVKIGSIRSSDPPLIVLGLSRQYKLQESSESDLVIQ